MENAQLSRLRVNGDPRLAEKLLNKFSVFTWDNKTLYFPVRTRRGITIRTLRPVSKGEFIEFFTGFLEAEYRKSRQPRKILAFTTAPN